MAEEEKNEAETTPDAPEAAAPETPEAAEAPAAQPAEPEAPAEPEPALSPKERRHRRRMKSRTEASPSTPEERQAARTRKAATRSRYRAKLKERRAAVRTEAPAPEADHAPEHGPGRPKVRQGVVISAKPDKTISVRIDVVRRHQRYHKILRTSMTLHAHDERNDAHEGDTVRIMECRPMSRSKRWRLVDILERAR
jgi:small subunit ribosomal protein S17